MKIYLVWYNKRLNKCIIFAALCTVSSRKPINSNSMWGNASCGHLRTWGLKASVSGLHRTKFTGLNTLINIYSFFFYKVLIHCVNWGLHWGTDMYHFITVYTYNDCVCRKYFRQKVSMRCRSLPWQQYYRVIISRLTRWTWSNLSKSGQQSML